jgi:hypothetical protein
MNAFSLPIHKRVPFIAISLLVMGVIIGLMMPMIARAASLHQPQQPDATTGVYLPLIISRSDSGTVATPTPLPSTTPTPSATPSATPTATTPAPTPANPLPTEIVATWFAGNALPTDFYNPQTGEWRDVNGLGQMYRFAADSGYTYTGFLRLQNGQCRSEVSVYKQGVASVEGNSLVLTQQMGKTRTVVICPTPQETITEDGAAVTTLDWSVAYDAAGHRQLTVTEGSNSTVFARMGIEPTLVGAWRNGDISSVGFYDAATQSFTTQTAVGIWFRFTADGGYHYGEFGYGQDNAGCQVKIWLYQAGTLTVSGSALTTTPTTGMVRIENECHPDQPQQEAWTEKVASYTWLFRDLATAPKLVLIPLEIFKEYIFVAE